MTHARVFGQALALCALLLATQVAHAVTYVVRSTVDSNNADGCLAGAATCSLREAITRANQQSNADTILFDIPGAGPHRIRPFLGLPAITAPLTINGYSQSGAVQNTSPTGMNAVLKIQIDGGQLINVADGLVLSAAVTVQGVSITGFNGTAMAGIRLNGNGRVRVEGCVIGLDPAFVKVANRIGIAVANTQLGEWSIGGSRLEQRNLISGNLTGGIETSTVATATPADALIENNLIGATANGNTAVADSGRGIRASRQELVIRNNTLIGDPDEPGIQLFSDALIVGNRIGIGGNLSTSAPHAVGISIGSNVAAIIGGVGSNANVIATNIGAGIAATGNFSVGDLARNHFSSNGGLAIDLGNAGVSANDPGDGDPAQQNFPLLTTAVRSANFGVPVAISGSLNSTANTHFRIVFLADLQADPSNHGEGRYIGEPSIEVVTDATGNISFGPTSTHFNETGLIGFVSAVAQRLSGPGGSVLDSSEMALSIPVVNTSPNLFVVTSSADTSAPCAATCTLRAAISAANGTPNNSGLPDQIHFNIPGAGPHTIIAATALPAITDALIIDGYTQPGAVPNSDATRVSSNAVIKVELRYASLPFSLAPPTPEPSRDLVLRGLAISAVNASENRDIVLTRTPRSRIEGCWFGLRADGSAAPMDELIASGIVGGAEPAQRNVFMRDGSGTSEVIRFLGTVLRNNLIGVYPNGRSTAAQAASALVEVRVDDALIEGNVFAGESFGLTINGARTVVRDNSFGESFDRQTALGIAIAVNVQQAGLLLQSSSQRIANAGIGVGFNRFEAVDAIIDQPIVNSELFGVVLFNEGQRVQIRQTISGSQGLAIDLQPGDTAGVTPNDPGDLDEGPNGLQNFPLLQSASRDGNGVVSVSGSLNSLPNQSYRIRVCGIANGLASGHGGCDAILVDDLVVITDSGGNVAFSVEFAADPALRLLTATASRLAGSAEETSEFAANIVIQLPDPLFANGFE